MSTNRIQKLLFSEYCDFEDMVLVESPFAETNREGKGLRQVHLGLTPSKLVLATDILPTANDSYILFIPGLDPDIETLELVAVYPIDCVNLSVFHRRKRQSLKARFCNNKVMYFELGGFEKRKMFWNLWCEKIKFLSPEETNFSHSETSVATSTSNSTLYLISSKRYTNRGASQIWCQYAAGDFPRLNGDPPKWPNKHLYMGEALDESPLHYTPLQLPPTQDEFVKKKADNHHRDPESQHTLSANYTSISKTVHNWPINRFQSGVIENCSTGLFLPIEDFTCQVYPEPSHSTQNVDLLTCSNQSVDMQCLQSQIHDQPLNFLEVANSALRVWEMQKGDSSATSIPGGRHRRRYAFAPQPHFHRGLGPWNVNQGERFTLQMKRAVSMVCIKKQPLDPELRLSVSRRQLVASISCENLYRDKKLINYNNSTLRNSHKSPVIFFWTPEYWYRPQSSRDAYQELQAHLNKIYQYHSIKDKLKKKFSRRRPKYEKFTSSSSLMESDNSISRSYFQKVQKDKKHSIIRRIQMSSKKTPFSCIGCNNEDALNKESSMQFLKRILRMEISLCAWDFDSDILATQLTLIDRDLLLKIIPEELSVLLWQQSSKNAPNIGAVIAFSHRISCLVTTEILKDDTEKIRARLITRFINVAQKCNNSNNFQSCRSILCGLQSPPIYRLYLTWNYVRKRHSSRYQVFEELCRLYRDVRLPSYQNSFIKASKSLPYLPFIGDIISKLLDIVPKSNDRKESTASTVSSDLGIKISIKQRNKHLNEQFKSTNIDSNIDQTPSMFQKIISSLKLWNLDDRINHKIPSDEFIVKTKKKTRMEYKSLADRYQAMYFYEDNRQERLKECILLLKTCQEAALSYNYIENQLAKEYLLKARYKEDQENFIQSFVVEVPCHMEK